TSIEILSPSNKTPGSQGRGLFLQKQRETLQKGVHLVEIDLLRAGTHATVVPLSHLRQQVPHFDYHVCVHRADRSDDYLIYPILMTNSLPVIEIPLLPEDGVVALPLQPAFNQSYDGGPYRREI